MSPRSTISVYHNAEIAHRLSELPGKCQNIHGHSLKNHLALAGQLDEHGLLCGLDFGTVKAEFRSYIDTNYDHHLLLNKDDPWAGDLIRADGEGELEQQPLDQLPGLVMCMGDPTTERMAVWIAEWAEAQYHKYGIAAVYVEVRETDTNGSDCAISVEGAP